MNATTLRERALGAYLGLAVGDALGATVEFMTAREIAHRFGVHSKMIGGGWLNLKPGEITDDTQMSLALGDAIIATGGWNLKAVAESFAAWLRKRPPDVGNTCRRGIRLYMTTGSLETPPNPGDGGNGACMRNYPLALVTLGDPGALRDWTLQQCHLTHNHPLSDAGTLAIGRMLHVLLDGGSVGQCRPIADDLVRTHPEFRFDPYPGRASGYIVDTIQTVLHFFFTTDNFADYLTAVVNRGEDADTTGAIAGMLAGAAYGLRDIPHPWLKTLDREVNLAITAQTDELLAIAARRLTPLKRGMRA